MSRRAREADRIDVDRLGPAIERDLDPARRRLAGQHFTAPAVADLVNAFCIRTGGDVVLDPACGTGSFLLRARARLKRLGGDGRTLRGVELDPPLAEAARANLPEARILTGDFLADGPAGDMDAIVGNPPYVRQERISEDRKRLLRSGAPSRLSLRSDLHVYFWHRAMGLLREGGRLGFLTGAAWLDASYGGPLRRWLAESFHIVAVIESAVESWFDDARVRTAIAIVERAPPGVRPPARFVSLERRLDEIAPPDLPEAGRLSRFEELARGIERRSRRPAADCRVRQVEPATLARSRWGPFLRQPDLYFEILGRAAGRLVPLSEVATVRWGIKTGDDRFFFVRRGAPPPVESRFLAPVVFNLMELDRLVVSRDQLRRRLLLIDLRRTSLRGLRVARHIRRAERERGSHLRPTCAARERKGKEPRRWFELRPGPPGQVLWSIMHQYRHLAPWNPRGFPANDNLLLIRAKPGIDPRLLAALLNSHLQALIKRAHGRQRNEGMLKTQAADVRDMLLPDPRRAGPGVARRLLEAFDRVAGRRIGKLPQECLAPDRRGLDLAALAAAGFGAKDAVVMADRLVEELASSCRSERSWELDAVGRRRSRGEDGRVRRAAPP